jgi:DNA-directed RNA polymerase beta subunit
MRQDFSKKRISLPLPDLLSIQLDSYKWLEQKGLTEILEELGTIEDYSGR